MNKKNQKETKEKLLAIEERLKMKKWLEGKGFKIKKWIEGG